MFSILWVDVEIAKLNLNRIFIGVTKAEKQRKSDVKRKCFTCSRFKTPHESILDATFTLMGEE